jgi:hypothetical protein
MECNRATGDVHEIEREHEQSLYALLRQVPDYRAKCGRRYEAATVLVILLLAKLAGESTLSGIAHWARLREPWLSTKGTSNGIIAATISPACFDLAVVPGDD